VQGGIGGCSLFCGKAWNGMRPVRLKGHANEDRTMTRTLALLALLGLAACETIEGAGRDLETAGEAITEEAQETQAGM